jgi:hypothetical protein
MTEGRLWALAAFAAIVLLLGIFMWPASRKLDGAQKYRRNRRPGADLDPRGKTRPSIPSAAMLLAFLTGHAVANSSDAETNVETGDPGSEGSCGGDGGGD